MISARPHQNFRRFALGVASAILFASLSAHAEPTAGKPMFGQWGVEMQYIAPGIKPGDDFYRHYKGFPIFCKRSEVLSFHA